MDSIGNIPLFISLLKELNPKRQRQIILRELLIALVIMIGFIFIGDAILSSLGISNYSILMSGGIILFIISLKMIFPSPHDHTNEYGKRKRAIHCAPRRPSCGRAGCFSDNHVIR
jgi:small neutral amino acid transporter SnatA (MarC family)